MKKIIALITALMWSSFYAYGESGTEFEEDNTILVGYADTIGNEYVTGSMAEAMLPYTHTGASVARNQKELKKIRGVALPWTKTKGYTPYHTCDVKKPYFDNAPALFLHPEQRYILCLSPLTSMGWIINTDEKKAYVLEPFCFRGYFCDHYPHDCRDYPVGPLMGSCGNNGWLEVGWLQDTFCILGEDYKFYTMKGAPHAYIWGPYIRTAEDKWRTISARCLFDSLTYYTLMELIKKQLRNITNLADNYYLSEYVYRYDETGITEDCLFIYGKQGIYRKGEDKPFYTLREDWHQYYSEHVGATIREEEETPYFHAFNPWTDNSKKICTLFYNAAHLPPTEATSNLRIIWSYSEEENGIKKPTPLTNEDLFFFHWISTITNTNYHRISYIYTNKNGHIIKEGEYYPREYNIYSATRPIHSMVDYEYGTLNKPGNTPQKIGSNAVAILIYRQRGYYIYHIIRPDTERIIEIHSGTQLYFLPRLLNGGKTLFAVSNDEWRGFDAPMPKNYSESWIKEHTLTSTPHAYFIELPEHIN